jgi:hypothetical protein
MSSTSTTRRRRLPPRRLGDDVPCPWGHVGDFQPPTSNGTQGRKCRVCKRELKAAKRAARRFAAIRAWEAVA